MEIPNEPPGSPGFNPPPGSALTPQSELLLDADYIDRIRSSYGDGKNGLVLGQPGEATELSLGYTQGGLVVSKRAAEMLTDDQIWIAELRHGLADWGEVDRETAEANYRALQFGGELKSAFHTIDGVEFTLITNKDWTCTSLQLKGEAPDFDLS